MEDAMLVAAIPTLAETLEEAKAPGPDDPKEVVKARYLSWMGEVRKGNI